MSGLNSLLREWDVAARYGVQISFEVLRVHDKFSGCCLRLPSGEGGSGIIGESKDTVSTTLTSR